MGHKVNPIGIRLGIARTGTPSGTPARSTSAEYLSADLKVREMLRKKLAQAGISKILIERPANNARVTIHRPPGRGDRQARRGHRSCGRKSPT